MLDFIDFDQIEIDINKILKNSFTALLSDETNIKRYSKLFDRTSEEGFYKIDKGKGEQPDWKPNEAYMSSLEDMWKPVEKFLFNFNIKLDQTLRSAFNSSREYKDKEWIHRRVFFGHFMDSKTNQLLSPYMLTVSHSHKSFHYNAPPFIQISKMLK